MPTGQRKAYFKNCSRRYFPSLILGIASALIGMHAGSDVEIVVYFCSMHVVYSACQRAISSLSLLFLKFLTFPLLNSNGILVHCVVANCNSDSTKVLLQMECIFVLFLPRRILCERMTGSFDTDSTYLGSQNRSRALIRWEIWIYSNIQSSWPKNVPIILVAI